MNTNTAVAPRPPNQHPTHPAPSAFEKAVMFGDITGLDERGRMDYVAELCKSLGLNPLGRAFSYINFGQGMTCYLTAMGASQLGTLHKVSITNVEEHGIVNGFYRITVTGGMPNGRTDIEFGSIAVTNKDGSAFSGLALENARKRCLTQAKTRLRKSLIGLSGMPSEDEKDDYGTDWGKVVTAPAGHQVLVGTGEVLEAPAEPLATTTQLATIERGLEKLRALDPQSDYPGPKPGLSRAQAKEEIASMADLIQRLEAGRQFAAQVAHQPADDGEV
ncbi:MAG TPA: hypothetical protein VN837_05430 [Chloroflexota bacterium]|nr:hypothetical protein [Chloroflexota bacterium]